MPEFPDWLRGLALLGQDGTDYVVIKVASTGELYTLIQGMHAGSPVTVAVDANGEILAVLKGEYGGTLVTVKLDAEGRLFTYVTDEIDQWGHILPGGFNELAGRLGSLQAYERRGQVVLQDSFEYGLSGWTFSGTAGYSAALDPTDFVHGGYSIHMKAAAASGNWVQAVRYYGGFPAQVGVGAAYWVRLEALGQDWILAIATGDGTNVHVGRIKGVVADSKLYYANVANSYVEFGTWDPAVTGYDYFRFLKVAIDTATGKYLYSVVDGVQFDMTTLSYYKPASTDRSLYSSFLITTSAASQAEAYVDSLVLTARETDEHI